MAFVNPWWLNIAFFFSHTGDSIRDLSSRKKLDRLTTMLFFKGGGHHFYSLVRPSSLSLAHRFCSSLSDRADFLLCSGHTALVLPRWVWHLAIIGLSCDHFTASLVGVGRERKLDCLFLTSAYSSLLFKRCSPQLPAPPSEGSMTVSTNNLYSESKFS